MQAYKYLPASESSISPIPLLTYDKVILLSDGLVVDDFVWIIQWGDERQRCEADSQYTQARYRFQHRHTHRMAQSVITLYIHVANRRAISQCNRAV